MAKRKVGRPKSKKGPKEWFMIRLPKAYKSALDKLKVKTRRSYTMEAQLALDAHLKLNGVNAPDTST